MLLDTNAGKLSFKPLSQDLAGKSFAVYINGNVNVNNTINTSPVSQHNEYFDISIDMLELENTAPNIQGFVEELNLIGGESQAEDDIYNVGTPYDMQLDEFYVSEWGIDSDLPTDVPNWINFLNATITEGVKFIIKPTDADSG